MPPAVRAPGPVRGLRRAAGGGGPPGTVPEIGPGPHLQRDHRAGGADPGGDGGSAGRPGRRPDAGPDRRGAAPGGGGRGPPPDQGATGQGEAPAGPVRPAGSLVQRSARSLTYRRNTSTPSGTKGHSSSFARTSASAR